MSELQVELLYEGGPRSTPPQQRKHENFEKKMYLFFNIISFQLYTLFPAMFDKFDILFIIRTVLLFQKPLTADITSSLSDNL